MFTIGCHLSSSKGFLNMAEEAVKINANTFQFFTRNPRGGAAKDLDLIDIEKFIKFSQKNGIDKILAHAPYTLNACSADPNIRDFALKIMIDDLERLEHIPGALYNFHPGSHLKQGVSVGISYIVKMLDEVLKQNYSTTILLETMAGKGSEIGKTFEEIKQIIDMSTFGEKLGVCLDTCHIWEAGYDIVNNLDNVLEHFDEVIGLNRLKAIHLNDTKNLLGAAKDRHECIGKGSLGIETITKIINHSKLKHLPFYLETPQDLDGYKEEISLLRTLYND
jgi:deoxyribonuclease-4